MWVPYHLLVPRSGFYSIKLILDYIWSNKIWKIISASSSVNNATTSNWMLAIPDIPQGIDSSVVATLSFILQLNGYNKSVVCASNSVSVNTNHPAITALINQFIIFASQLSVMEKKNLLISFRLQSPSRLRSKKFSFILESFRSEMSSNPLKSISSEHSTCSPHTTHTHTPHERQRKLINFNPQSRCTVYFIYYFILYLFNFIWIVNRH